MPGWLYGEYNPRKRENETRKENTTKHHHDYNSEIGKWKTLRKTLYELNSNLSNHIYRCCGKTSLIQTVRPIFDIRFDTLPAECTYAYYDLPIDCIEATECTHATGVYHIILEKFSDQPFLVWCDVVKHGGDWTVIQRRHDGSEDFERKWSDYAHGFGEIQGEFFIGLDKLHAMTNYNGPQELLIILRDRNETKYALYDNFVVGSKHDYYTLFHVGAYRGTAGDSLRYHLKQKFTTKDRDNDKSSNYNCAKRSKGAWWYNNCHQSNLNGKYENNTYGRGINWLTFRGYEYSIPYVEMMIRRRTFNSTL